MRTTDSNTCLEFGPASMNSDHIDCPVIVEGTVCQCECTECKRAWWKMDRPTKYDLCVVCGTFQRPLYGDRRCRVCFEIESHIRLYLKSECGRAFVSRALHESSAKPLCNHVFNGMRCTQEKNHSTLHVYSTKK